MLLQVLLEAGQTIGPKGLVIGDPVPDAAQRRRTQAANTRRAAGLSGDETGSAQHAKMPGHGGAATAEMRGNFSHGPAAAAQQAKNLTPRGVGNGAENAVGFRNHFVTLSSGCRPAQSLAAGCGRRAR